MEASEVGGGDSNEEEHRGADGEAGEEHPAGVGAGSAGFTAPLQDQLVASMGAAKQEVAPQPLALSLALAPLSQEHGSRKRLHEVREQRRQAAWEEHSRLAAEQTQHIKSAYERLTTQNAWPIPPGNAALPKRTAELVEWFFQESPFRDMLHARHTEAAAEALSQKLKRQRKQCEVCQAEAWQNPHGAEPACVLHKALSAVDEVRLEVALRAEWAEQAVAYAVRCQQRQAEAAERARLQSLAAAA